MCGGFFCCCWVFWFLFLVFNAIWCGFQDSSKQNKTILWFIFWTVVKLVRIKFTTHPCTSFTHSRQFDIFGISPSQKYFGCKMREEKAETPCFSFPSFKTYKVKQIEHQEVEHIITVFLMIQCCVSLKPGGKLWPGKHTGWCSDFWNNPGFASVYRQNVVVVFWVFLRSVESFLESSIKWECSFFM